MNISDIVFFVGFFYDIFYMRFMLQQKKNRKEEKNGSTQHSQFIYLFDGDCILIQNDSQTPHSRYKIHT